MDIVNCRDPCRLRSDPLGPVDTGHDGDLGDIFGHGHVNRLGICHARHSRSVTCTYVARARTIVSGLFVGMTWAAGYLVRPVSIVWTALLSAYVALWLVQSLLARKNLQASSAPAIRFTMINWTCACLVVLTTVGLWTMRNQRSLGQPIWATTHGGYTLLLANNPPLYNHLRSPGWPTFWEPDLFFAGWAAREAGDLTNESFWQSPPVPMPITADELTDDRVAGQAAKATIARDPAMFTYSCLVRLYWLWSPTPQQGPTLQRIAVTAWYLLVYGLVVCSIWKHRGSWFRPQWIAGWMLVVALSVTHAVYWSNLRMRAPAMPFIAIVAAYAFTSRKNLANM